VSELTDRKAPEEALRQQDTLASMGHASCGRESRAEQSAGRGDRSTDLMSRTERSKRVADRAAKIVQAAERCARIVKDLLAFEAGGLACPRHRPSGAGPS
jgi:hypothetical protein